MLKNLPLLWSILDSPRETRSHLGAAYESYPWLCFTRSPNHPHPSLLRPNSSMYFPNTAFYQISENRTIGLSIFNETFKRFFISTLLSYEKDKTQFISITTYISHLLLLLCLIALALGFEVLKLSQVLWVYELSLNIREFNCRPGNFKLGRL